MHHLVGNTQISRFGKSDSVFPLFVCKFRSSDDRATSAELGCALSFAEE